MDYDLFKLNHLIIDKQHKFLLKLVNELIELKNDENSDYDDLLKSIAKLKQYVNFHFVTEEAYMLRYEFPLESYNEHIEEHCVLLRKINDFETKFKYKNVMLLDLMIDFLKKWIIKHFFETDYKLVTYINKVRLDETKKETRK